MSERRTHDWPWDSGDSDNDEGNEIDSEDIGDKDGERQMLRGASKRNPSNLGEPENTTVRQRDYQQHVDNDDGDSDGDDDEQVDSDAIWKLRDELAVLNAKVKGLEDELEDELEGSEDQASTQVQRTPYHCQCMLDPARPYYRMYIKTVRMPNGPCSRQDSPILCPTGTGNIRRKR